ncbi:response regulator transcription factor [Thermoflavimicrobium dichotomicum]|uniref:DNA-binding response regulator, OmpR family, contains REC and winged-helix (WHTH) domain n=1 Tax=Thermoflavimicrobium dichotomicum TaxID=46223 RepID=A0A1I3MJD6_9BACL|nr:response regulator transcription factor [Thermoflavimicrobium dichotomicum]SFI97128.1 DNA-binding response regulator, OmpR family, contains REC and winged-helix (wHTH) domain [Thermoflavimicrobium dichotomicum]
MRILVAEDDQSVCEMLQVFLVKEGFDVHFVHDGLAALREWEKRSFDLLILDWMLPKIDGIQVCQQVRAKSDVPILMLTARTEDEDQIMGLNTGADDYVTKPFRPLTLIARIKALLRRSNREKKEEYSRIFVDEDAREIILDGEKVGRLTPKEFDLLCLFIRHPKRVFSREELLERIWGFDYYGDERTVDAHIKRLRKKINKKSSQKWIQTVWGVGYRFVPEESEPV